MNKTEILQNLKKNYYYYRDKAKDHYDLGKDNYYYQKYNAKADHYYALMVGVEKLHETKHVVKHEALNLQRVSQRSELACDLLRKISNESMCSVVADEWINEFLNSQACG